MGNAKVISKPYTLSGTPTTNTVEKVDAMFTDIYKILQDQNSLTLADVLKRTSFRG